MHMKTRFYSLIAAFALGACSNQPGGDGADKAQPAPAAAQNQAPAEQPAKPQTPEEAAKAELVNKAKALTQDDIMQSHDPNALSKLGQIYAETGETERFTWTLQRLTQLFPNSGNLRLQLAMAYAGAGEKTPAYDSLLRLISQGYSYDIGKDPRFEGAHGTKVWDYIVQTFENNNKPFGDGKVAFDLPKGDYLFESIAWDPKRKQFLVGSARDGGIYIADGKGGVKEFIKADSTNGLMAVFGLAVDADHDKLYAISNGVAHFNHFDATMVGKAGVYEFALSSGKFLHKAMLPVDDGRHILSSITIDAKGKLYVADGVVQQIYRLDGGELKLVAGNSALSGIRGIAVSGDGQTLYFADEALGLFGIDLAQGKPFAMTYNENQMTLGGIDGLYWFDGTLVAIQNEISPKRVMRFRLGSDGRSIAQAQPLDAAQEAFTLPTVGTVSGQDLYFIANSQKSLYSDLGVLTDADKLKPVQIFRTNLLFAWNQKSPSMPAPPKLTPEELEKMRTTPPKGFNLPTGAEPPKAAPTPATPVPEQKS
jgi:sugar lactone lactonase YvrE